MRQHNLDKVVVLASALKHGVSAADVRHAVRNAVTLVEIEYDGEAQLMTIGPAHNGDLLEVVVVPADEPVRAIHAQRLRAPFYRLLRSQRD